MTWSDDYYIKVLQKKCERILELKDPWSTISEDINALYDFIYLHQRALDQRKIRINDIFLPTQTCVFSIEYEVIE
jgi:hypothetical protein